MTNRIAIAALVMWSALGVSAPAAQQTAAPQPSQKIDVSRLGPLVGHVVPDLRPQDAQGKVWTRDSIMGSKGAMLVFSRSVDWCPYRKTHVIEADIVGPDFRDVARTIVGAERA